MPRNIKEIGKNKHLLTVEVGKNPGTGKRKRKRIIFDGGKKAAEREYDRLQAEGEKGAFLDTAKMTFGDYLKRWLVDYGTTRLAPTTQRRYGQIINLRVIPKLGQVPLIKLKATHLRTFFKELLEEGKLDGSGPLSHDSVVYHYRVIHKVLDSALKEDLIDNNPANAVEVPKSSAEIENVDETDNAKILIGKDIEIAQEAAKDTSHFTLLYVALRTGLRRGELLGLRWTDMDFREKTLSVQRSLAYTPKKGIFFKVPKTKKSRRKIDISDEVIQALKAHKKKQKESKLFHGQAYQDNDLVFCQADGKPLHPDTPSSWFPGFLEGIIIHKPCNNRIKKADKCPHCDKKPKDEDLIRLPRLTFHCLRHTHASLLLQAGVDIKVISERLGHSSIRITYDLYSHLMPGMQKDAVAKLETILK